jgi:hypothetical protein
VQHLAGFGHRSNTTTDDDDKRDDQGQGRGGPRGTLVGWVVYLVKLLMITSGAFLWLDFLWEWLYFTTNPDALALETELMVSLPRLPPTACPHSTPHPYPTPLQTAPFVSPHQTFAPTRYCDCHSHFASAAVLSHW